MKSEAIVVNSAAQTSTYFAREDREIFSKKLHKKKEKILFV